MAAPRSRVTGAELSVASLGHVGNSVVVRGGLEIYLDRLGAALTRRGVRVTTRADPPLAAAAPPPALAQLFGSFYALEGAFRACEGRPRVVFPMLLHSDAALAAWRPPADRLRSRLPWSLLSARRRILAGADLVVASSAAEARESRGFGARRVEVLLGGVDLDLPADRRTAEELGSPWSNAAKRWLEASQRCVAIGRFEQRKSQAAIARACARLGVGALFIGRRSPVEPRYLERVETALGEASGIWEDPPDGLLQWALQRAGAHVLATRHETIGLVSLEAAAAGCRPVAIDQPTSREYLRPFGELAGDPGGGELAAAIRRALERGRLAPAERDLLEPMSWDAMARRLVELYRDLLGEAS